MDKVRLGRALGYGTRHAAKTLAAVAEAATAPDPRSSTPSPNVQRAQPAAKPEVVAAPGTRETRRSALPRVPSAAVVRDAGRSMWGPLATFSGALWLRVTGLFFGLIALAMANGAWRLRDRVAINTMGSAAMHRFWLFALFAGLFGYFAVSSFVRATLRERRGPR